MGSRVGDRCFDTVSEASDQFFSSQAVGHSAGVTSYLSWFEKVGGVWYLKRESVASNGAVTSLGSSGATVPVFPACSVTDQFFDGMTIGWAVAGAMLLAYGVKLLARAVEREHDI